MKAEKSGRKKCIKACRSKGKTGTEKVKGNVYAHFTHAAIAMKPYVSNKAKVSKSTSAVGKPPLVYSDDMACGDGEMCEEIFVQTM